MEKGEYVTYQYLSTCSCEIIPATMIGQVIHWAMGGLPYVFGYNMRKCIIDFVNFRMLCKLL